jgi:aminomuconate-semialdehyde/2-hydroxymuconate-6-semialdehyde dehydrogenase
LRVGTVWINTWLKRDLRVPFGGMKASGIGREGGAHSFDFYTETKTVCVQLGGV